MSSKITRHGEHELSIQQYAAHGGKANSSWFLSVFQKTEWEQAVQLVKHGPVQFQTVEP